MSIVCTEFGWKNAQPTCAHEYVLPAVQASALCGSRPIALVMEVDDYGG